MQPFTHLSRRTRLWPRLLCLLTLVLVASRSPLAAQSPAPAQPQQPPPASPQPQQPSQQPPPSPPTAETSKPDYEPKVGQPGKDVVWVPTPHSLVEKMLDLARVGPDDFVVDLGSGDGRTIIAAAKRGARALGVEFNPDMVELSRRTASREGVSDRAMFVEGDLFTADISRATVLALFLLSENLGTLLPKFLDLPPGSRIVVNTFGIPGWTADETATVEEDCSNWCTALLWIVPAKVEGAWQSSQGTLTLSQTFQMVTGSLASGDRTVQIEQGRLRGADLTFVAGGAQYSVRVNGERMEGTVTAGGASKPWSASRSRG